MPKPSFYKNSNYTIGPIAGVCVKRVVYTFTKRISLKMSRITAIKEVTKNKLVMLFVH